MSAGPEHDDLVKDAMHRAGRLLSVRARSEQEIRRRLSVAGYEDDVIETVVSRLVELRLLDDHEFATRWVEERSRMKAPSHAALVHELRSKGVPGYIIDSVMVESAPGEDELAREAALKMVRRVSRFPLREQAQKLQAALMRKGFSLEAAMAGARHVLPPEDWD